jgi:hypothetical protein
MSTTVVTPPDMAALVPVQKPSQCVRPGSFKCTCTLERGLLASTTRTTRDLLYESRQDNVIPCVDDLSVTVVSVQWTFNDGENCSLVSIDDDGSLGELVVVRKEDLRAMEDDLV